MFPGFSLFFNSALGFIYLEKAKAFLLLAKTRTLNELKLIFYVELSHFEVAKRIP